ELRPRDEVLLVVQPDADAVAHAPAASRALVRCGLAHRLDQQLLDLVAIAVALDARAAGIDDVLDSRHRQRSLGDVGREDDAARAVRLEHAVLLLLAQAREQQHDLDTRRMMPAPMPGPVADLALVGPA